MSSLLMLVSKLSKSRYIYYTKRGRFYMVVDIILYYNNFLYAKIGKISIPVTVIFNMLMSYYWIFLYCKLTFQDLRTLFKISFPYRNILCDLKLTYMFTYIRSECSKYNSYQNSQCFFFVFKRATSISLLIYAQIT